MTKPFLIVLSLILTVTAAAQVSLTKEEALQLYFPNAAVERKTLFLTDEQVERIQATARSRVESKIVPYYVGKRKEGIIGYAFFDTHIIRTMPETFLVVVNPDSTVRAVEILAFYEPEDYRPPKRWLDLFGSKSLSGDLWLKRGVQNIIGATLSAQAITEGVRKMLAVYEIAVPKPE